MNLTPSRLRILRAIAEYRVVHNEGPSVRTLAKILDRSRSTMMWAVNELVVQGAVVKATRQSHGAFSLTEEAKTRLGVMDKPLNWPVRGTLSGKGLVIKEASDANSHS